MIRTFLFDLGNVLVKFSHERMCGQIAALAGAHPAAVRTALFDRGLLPPFERGQASPEEFQRRLEAELHLRFPADEFSRAASDIFEVDAAMRQLLEVLRHRGYRLVMLSNTSVMHYDWLRARCDVFSPFHALVLSFQAGAIKPERAIYERALEEIHCDPQECFYTDDIADYVAAGRRAGLDAERFTGAEMFRRQLGERGVML